jgi:hypothetical protein
MKTKTNAILSALVILASLCAVSCSMNPLAQGYRSAPGVPKRDWQNSNPALVQTSMASHDSTVSRYTRKGYQVIGYGQINFRSVVDGQNARMLAMEKNADVAVFSKNYLGKRSEQVQVPVTTVQTTAYNQYQNSNQYASSQQAGAQSTVYEYRDQAYDLYGHKTTLLRKN